MLPPCPLLISIPSALITIFMPVVVSMVMPPAPGRSFKVMVPMSVLSTFISAMAGRAGTSPTPQKQPLHIG